MGLILFYSSDDSLAGNPFSIFGIIVLTLFVSFVIFCTIVILIHEDQLQNLFKRVTVPPHPSVQYKLVQEDGKSINSSPNDVELSQMASDSNSLLDSKAEDILEFITPGLFHF